MASILIRTGTHVCTIPYETAEGALSAFHTALSEDNTSPWLIVKDEMDGEHWFNFNEVLAISVDAGIVPEWLVAQQAYFMARQHKIQQTAERMVKREASPQLDLVPMSMPFNPNVRQ